MAPDVAETDINMLLEFGCSLSRDDAAQLLRVSNFDVEAAANKYFDKGGDIKALRTLWESNYSSTTWDGSAFGADRYGQTESNNIPTFNIECAPEFDNYPRSGVPSGAPSRPPSRTSQRSGVSAGHGGAPQQSIENSQELGVIGNSRPVFGPATKDYYDATNWALVPTSTSAEVVPDPEPSSRKRLDQRPAILKPLANDDYLPALITILHSIPLFRNTLLVPSVSQDDYWAGDDWWKGNPSPPARTVDNTSEVETTRHLELIHETQRLAGFLDGTDRAYGSVGSLLELDAMREPRQAVDDPDDLTLRFLLNWGDIYEKIVPDPGLNGILRSSFIAAGNREESFKLDVNVISQDATTERTLYDALDDLLFANVGGSAHIVDISNVLILKLNSTKSDATSLNCKIPAVFYADRYLLENKPAVDKILLEMSKCEEAIKDIDEKMRKLKYHTPQKVPRSEPLDALKLLKTSMKAFEPEGEGIDKNAKNATILSELQTLYENIEKKLATLESQKKKAQETFELVSSRFKAPMDDHADTAMDVANGDATDALPFKNTYTHPYQLRGVSTDPKVYYILHSDTQPKERSTQVWWRIRYDVGYPPKIIGEKVSLEDVLGAVSSEYRSALVVYANDNATSVPCAPLPTPIQRFVQRDNVNFLQELQEEQQNNGWAETGDDGSAVQGQWDTDYGNRNWDEEDTTWNDISAKNFHEQEDSRLSSTTLTPNTEVGDEGVGMVEMQEVNGGISAWAGVASNASSDTVGADAMDIVESQLAGPQGAVSFKDIEMNDMGPEIEREQPRVQYIEVVEKDTSPDGTNKSS